MNLHTSSPPRPTTPSANDNGPLTSGQVKALKIAIAVMGVMIIAALLAIVGRVIYLSANKPGPAAPPATAVAASGATLAPEHKFSLPPGAQVKDMALRGNRLVVNLSVDGLTRARVYDLTNGKLLSEVIFEPSAPTAR